MRLCESFQMPQSQFLKVPKPLQFWLAHVKQKEQEPKAPVCSAAGLREHRDLFDVPRPWELS